MGVGWLTVIFLLIAAVHLFHSRLVAVGAAEAASRAGAAQDISLDPAMVADGSVTRGCASVVLVVTETDDSASATATCIRHDAQARGMLGGDAEATATWEQAAWPSAPPA